MKKIFKNHVGLIIILAIIFAFPVSLSTQARLNSRVIVTGLAIDKNGWDYEITAQFVKTAPNSKSQESKAEINFISDTGESVTSTLSKLLYKTGKMTGFSHTNYIILGSDLLEEDVTQFLDYFIRDNVIEDSVCVLFAEKKAKDEIEKTKELDLTVGIGLQKVFLYKEKESDGVMTSLMEFLRDSKEISKTSLASEVSLESQKKDSNQQESGESSNGDESGKQKQESQYFKSISPVVCFVDGKFVGKLEDDEELQGFMLAKEKCSVDDLYLKNLSFGQLNEASAGIKIKNKKVSKKIRYEGNIPCLDIVIKVKNAEITEFQNKDVVMELASDEFDYIKQKIKEDISSKVAKAFEKSTKIKADIFKAYSKATKFHYSKTTQNFASLDEFLSALKLNVIVEVSKLEY